MMLPSISTSSTCTLINAYNTKHFKWGNKIQPLLTVINLCDEFIDYLMELCVSDFLSVCSSITLIVEV